MTKLTWDATGERFYEAGTDRGVLYLDGTGHPWNGLVSVEESPSGGETEYYYQDGIPYVSESKKEEFKGTIEAFTYPNAFMLCDGSQEMAQGLYISQQARKSFGLSYRTLVGNDLEELDHAYKIHIIYEATAQPARKSHSTLGDQSDATVFSWGIVTRQVKFEDAAFGVKYGAHLTLDSREVYPWAMQAVEDVLYGTDTTEPRLPTPQELLALFVDNALLKVTDNGDHTYTIEGPDALITDLGNDEFEIDWESVIHLNEDEVQISSL